MLAAGPAGNLAAEMLAQLGVEAAAELAAELRRCACDYNAPEKLNLDNSRLRPHAFVRGAFSVARFLMFGHCLGTARRLPGHC